MADLQPLFSLRQSSFRRQVFAASLAPVVGVSVAVVPEKVDVDSVAFDSGGSPSVAATAAAIPPAVADDIPLASFLLLL